MRTDQFSGLFACILGVMMIAFGVFSLLMVGLQRVMLFGLPPIPQDARGIAFTKATEAIHLTWLIYMPLMIVGGLVFAVTGVGVFRGSEIARRVPQVNALLGYIWLAAYAVSCYHVWQIPFPGLNESAIDIFRWISLISGTLGAAVLPTALLYALSRPRSTMAV
jgi:hypothetical protein